LKLAHAAASAYAAADALRVQLPPFASTHRFAVVPPEGGGDGDGDGDGGVGCGHALVDADTDELGVDLFPAASYASTANE